VAGTCECGNEPWGSIKCGEFLGWELVSFSSRTLPCGVSKLLILYGKIEANLAAQGEACGIGRNINLLRKVLGM
jgi:hypothetical protein